MQLFLINVILVVYALSAFVRADAVTDAIHLQVLASNTADTVFASLNGTAYLVGYAGLVDEYRTDKPRTHRILSRKSAPPFKGQI